MKKLLLLAAFIVCSVTCLSAKNVTVTVSPEHAIILQKGKIIQPVTPGVFNLNVSFLSSEVFTAQADGYDSQQFVVSSKSPETMRITLKPNRKQVSFSAEPSTATIYVDGRELGKGVVDFTINKNESKTVKVVQDGYDTYIKHIGFNDQSDTRMSYNVSLEQNRKEVNILVDTPSAEFWFNGVLVAKGKIQLL